MLQYPPDPSTIRILTLAQLCPLGSWQLALAHDRPHSLLIWMTRGQGVAMFDGRRHGLGAHNALFVPARQLVSLDVGRQGYGQAILLPLGIEMTMPEGPRHIRARDVSAQTELTAIFEAMSREQNAERPLWHSSMDSYGQLAMIWLRRQLAENAPHIGPETASARLMRAYSQRLVMEHTSGETMADHANALGVTPTHLTRVCRAETGRTAAALLNERILHSARSLLNNTDAAIREIAEYLGFSSAAYFTRFIQQHTGNTPSGLRDNKKRVA